MSGFIVVTKVVVGHSTGSGEDITSTVDMLKTGIPIEDIVDIHESRDASGARTYIRTNQRQNLGEWAIVDGFLVLEDVRAVAEQINRVQSDIANGYNTVAAMFEQPERR